jgi:hypothetical protein
VTNRALGIVVLTLTALAASSGSARAAQQRAPATPPRASQDESGVKPITAAQIQMLFEAFIVTQAQDALQLSEAQYGRFVTTFKRLQKARSAQQQQRARLLADLRRMTAPDAPPVDEAQMTDRLRALRELEDTSAVEIRKAYDAVDETLDLRQRARFRVFEERMEQQKLQFVMRARENARALARRGRDGR